MSDEPNNTEEQPIESSSVSEEAAPAAETGTTASEEGATSEATAPGATEDTASSESTSPADELQSLEDAEAAIDDDDDDDDDDGPVEDVEPLELIDDTEVEVLDKRWYILKVQSNRETSIADALRRRVKVAGLEEYVDEVIVPVEEVAEYKGGKKRTVKRKLYPGYIVVNMAITDDTWFLVRETPGIGDFTGSAGKPAALGPDEINRILKTVPTEDGPAEPVKPAIPFKPGEMVRIKEGTFENFEGQVDGIDEINGRVTVMINIFGRSTPVELEHWQIEEV